MTSLLTLPAVIHITWNPVKICNSCFCHIPGVIFYQEFQSAAFLSVFMFLFGCLLSFLSVFVIAVNKKEERLQVPYIDCGSIPGK
ncbi:hypothetical protein CIB84_007436 [Bambusicola thoracicus]|uniref:Uncharacterized protein n=1 Tax=Bambusicola thoracicus TaxID=9083 RepID=A0A2P4SXI4_BAMTH|nr:hypothetical protein CIB84_007436 [Bambusicola thoracicus]